MSTPVHPPAVDDLRRRLRLTLDEVAALAALHAGQDLADVGVEVDPTRLRDAGLLGDEGLPPLAADLVTALARPTFRVLAETVGPQGPVLAEVVVSGETVWASDPFPADRPDAVVLWQRTDLQVLLWELARLVGLRKETAADLDPIDADVGSVDPVVALIAVAPEHTDTIRTTAVARSPASLAHLSEGDRSRLVLVLANLQASWRLTSLWGDPDADGGTRGLAVLDAGALGYWQRTAPAEPMTVESLAPATPLRLEPVGTAQLWRGLADLLPSGAELRRAAGLVP